MQLAITSYRNVQNFSTHSGLFRYTRLVQGATSAFEEYQHSISQLFRNTQRTKNISDDILVGGIDQADHDKNLAKCFEILSNNNLTANVKKCVFSVEEVTFFGFKISKDGIRPSESKVEAVHTFEEPHNPKEVSSFLGLVNYLARFIPNLSAESVHLRNLTKTNADWIWGEKEKMAFQNLKMLVTGDLVMAHFNVNYKTFLIVDGWRPIGLGAIICQQQTDDSIRPDCFCQ